MLINYNQLQTRLQLFLILIPGLYEQRLFLLWQQRAVQYTSFASVLEKFPDFNSQNEVKNSILFVKLNYLPNEELIFLNCCLNRFIPLILVNLNY